MLIKGCPCFGSGRWVLEGQSGPSCPGPPSPPGRQEAVAFASSNLPWCQGVHFPSHGASASSGFRRRGWLSAVRIRQTVSSVTPSLAFYVVNADPGCGPEKRTCLPEVTRGRRSGEAGIERGVSGPGAGMRRHIPSSGRCAGFRALPTWSASPRVLAIRTHLPSTFSK